jgi:hypothetical protein
MSSTPAMSEKFVGRIWKNFLMMSRRMIPYCKLILTILLKCACEQVCSARLFILVKRAR